MIEAEHSDAEPEPGRADAAAEARGEKKTKGEKEENLDTAPCSPREAEANAKQTAQRAS